MPFNTNFLDTKAKSKPKAKEDKGKVPVKKTVQTKKPAKKQKKDAQPKKPQPQTPPKQTMPQMKPYHKPATPPKDTPWEGPVPPDYTRPERIKEKYNAMKASGEKMPGWRQTGRKIGELTKAMNEMIANTPAKGMPKEFGRLQALMKEYAKIKEAKKDEYKLGGIAYSIYKPSWAKDRTVTREHLGKIYKVCMLVQEHAVAEALLKDKAHAKYRDYMLMYNDLIYYLKLRQVLVYAREVDPNRPYKPTIPNDEKTKEHREEFKKYYERSEDERAKEFEEFKKIPKSTYRPIFPEKHAPRGPGNTRRTSVGKDDDVDSAWDKARDYLTELMENKRD